MGIQTTIVGNRDQAGRFTRLLGARRARATAFAERTAGRLAVDWSSTTRSKRVASAIRVVRVTSTSFRVEARTADVGFNPAFVEHDTRPHVIRPTRGHGLLVFPMNGGLFFNKGSVNHPGTKGDRSLRRARARAAAPYREGLRRIWVEGGQ